MSERRASASGVYVCIYTQNGIVCYFVIEKKEEEAKKNRTICPTNYKWFLLYHNESTYSHYVRTLAQSKTGPKRSKMKERMKKNKRKKEKGANERARV